MAKKTVSAKESLSDIRAGMDVWDLCVKYGRPYELEEREETIC